jgi:hypothetical protein
VGDGPVTVAVPDASVSVICLDPLESSFVTPTLTSWSVVAYDNELAGARVALIEAVTAGSPCRIKLTLVHAGASEQYATKYSSPDAQAHAGMSTDILLPADRGLDYDLYWTWTSGNETGGPELVAAEAVYVPTNGEGDVPSDSED